MFEEKSQKIKIKKDMILSEIETQLINEFDYKNISIVIKKTLRNGIIRPEILNHREKKVVTETPDKPINEESPLEMKNQFKTFGNLCVSCQYLLFIDDSCSTKSSWASYFKKENNMIVINFNYPLEENQVVETIEYPFRLKVDLRQGLMDFKNILEKYVSEVDHEKYKPKEIKDDKAEETKKEIEKENVPMDDITNETYMKLVEHQKCLKVSNTKNLIMKKGGKSGVELKNMKMTLRKIGFINNSFIFLRFGRKTVVGEIKVNLFYCLNSLNSSKFSLKRQIYYFGETHILSKLNASQVLDQLKKEYPVLQEKKLLLREKNMNVLTKVFRNYSLRGQYVFDRKNLVIEESVIDIPQKDEVYIYYTILTHNSESNEIDEIKFEPIQQMVVNKQNNLYEMGELILTDFQAKRMKNDVLSSINIEQKNKTETSEKSLSKNDASNCTFLDEFISMGVENLSCTKIRDVGNFESSDIMGHKFFRMNRNDQVISSSPFYLENDGCLFILKKKGASFSKKLRVGMSKRLVRNNGFFDTGGEQGLQIYVKKKG